LPQVFVGLFMGLGASFAVLGLITLLFKVRDRVLSYQKGQMKW
jgi:hypothetical protein